MVSVSTEYFLERAEAELANIHEVVIEEEGYTRKKKNEVVSEYYFRVSEILIYLIFA